jgi:putative salt-induced outer membrane protein YdiY
MLNKTVIAALASCAMAAGAMAQETTPAPTATAAAAEPKKPTWESSVGFGLTLTKGNSDTLMATANFLTGKKWDKNELAFGADGTYGENNGTKNAESAHAFGQYNRLLNDRLFGFGRVEGLYDALAFIDYRATVSVGLGYYFIKNDRMTLSAEVGPGWVAEKVAGNTAEYFTIRFAEKFEYKLNKTARIWELAEYMPQVDNWGNYLATLEVGVETSISKSLNLRTYIQDTYRSEPAPGAKENDLKLVAGVLYKF